MNIKEIKRENVDRIELLHNGAQKRDLVKTIMKLWFIKRQELS
jgi:hypothetical protein